jgi:hypothetical protein
MQKVGRPRENGPGLYGITARVQGFFEIVDSWVGSVPGLGERGRLK